MNWKDEITLVVPCKLESKDRIENLAAFVTYAKKISNRPVSIIECDTRPKAQAMVSDLPNVRYMFVTTNSPGYWSRSLPINQGVMWATTDVVAPWDMDVVIEPSQVEESVCAILEDRADWAIPFTKLHVVKHELHREVLNGSFSYNVHAPGYLHTIIAEEFFGAANIFRREVFQHVRGFSERHIGWGSEDAEIGARMKTLGYRLFRHPGPAWHIEHEREAVTTAPQLAAIDRNIQETRRVEAMTNDQLRAYYGVTSEIGEYFKRR
jgi:GT2 family glycosyltransferase